jgi:hypothetical protein
MRKLLVTGTAVLALAIPAVATAGNGYGATTNTGCGATYGQLVSAGRQAGHVVGGVNGARNWVESGLAAAHGCAV